MKERKLTINLAHANIFSAVLLLIAGALAALIWYPLWGKPTLFSAEPGDGASDAEFKSWLIRYILEMVGVLVAFVGGIIIHELIHGITWAHYAKSGWKSISFGVIWKMLAPYCHCSEPIQVKPYIIGALMPLIILGILPLIVGLCIGSIWTTIFGVFFISAANGDILVVWTLRHEKATSTVLDHPTEAGCIIYEEDTEEPDEQH